MSEQITETQEEVTENSESKSGKKRTAREKPVAIVMPTGYRLQRLYTLLTRRGFVAGDSLLWLVGSYLESAGYDIGGDRRDMKMLAEALADVTGVLANDFHDETTAQEAWAALVERLER